MNIHRAVSNRVGCIIASSVQKKDLILVIQQKATHDLSEGFKDLMATIAVIFLLLYIC